MYLIKKLSVVCLFTLIISTAWASTEPAVKVQVVFEKITAELKRFDSQGQLQRDNTLIVLEQFLKPEIEEKYFAYKVLALQLKKLSAEQKTQMIELLLKMLMNNYAGLLEKYDNERIVIGETEFGNIDETIEELSTLLSKPDSFISESNLEAVKTRFAKESSKKIQSILDSMKIEEYSDTLDSGIFDIKFNEPQNFASYRQAEMDSQRVGVYGQIEGLPYMSKRFMMARFLGLTEDEMLENEKLWAEEHNENESITPSGDDMRSVGISPGGIEGDLETGAELDNELDIDAEGGDVDDGGDAPQET